MSTVPVFLLQFYLSIKQLLRYTNIVIFKTMLLPWLKIKKKTLYYVF